jgi:RecA/RadA recombinase
MSISDKLMRHKEFGEFMITSDKEFEYISTNVIVLNLLFSGQVRGGLQKGGINHISADSSLGKTFIGLSALKEAQKLGMECYVIDAEKSFDFGWAKKLGIDTDKKSLPVIKTSQIIKIKQFITFIMEGKTLLERNNVFILFDSWGPLVSAVMKKKAGEASETRDMSLPFWKNELANIMKETDFTYFVMNHVYANTGGFGDPLAVPGGKRLYFNSDNVVLGQSKAKDKAASGDITGAIITALAHKGRKAKEKSKLKYRIKHEGGLDMFFGLLPDALEHGCVIKPKNGYYSRPCVEDDKPWREKNIYCPEFWAVLFQKTDFELYLDTKYTYSGKIEIGETSLSDILDTKILDTAVVKKTVKKEKANTKRSDKLSEADMLKQLLED